MAVYGGNKVSGWFGRPLSQLPLSVNYDDQITLAFEPTNATILDVESGDRLYGFLLDGPYHDVVSHSNDGVSTSHLSPLHGHWVLLQNGEMVRRYDLALGAVSIGTVHTYNMWNDIDVLTTIISVSLSEASVFSINGIQDDDTFNPYEEKQISFELLPAAPPVFDITLTIVTDTAGTIVYRLYGITSIPIPILPVEFKETIAFKTEVLSAVDGTEQRIATRAFPRVVYSAQYMVPPDYNGRRLQMILATAYPKAMQMPSWGLLEKLSYIPAVDDTEILFDPQYGSYQTGGTVVLWQDNVKSETFLISSVLSDRITLSVGVSTTFTGPVYICPTDSSYATQPEYQDDGNGMVFCTLETEGTFPFSVTPYTFPTTYNGKYVLTDTTNLFEEKTENHTIISDVQRLDSGVGLHSINYDWIDSKPTYTRGFHLMSPQDCWEFRQKLYYFQGRLKTAYIPTMDNDFIITRTVGSIDTIIYCENNYFSRFYDPTTQQVFNHVAITDGTTWYFRQITGVNDLDETEQTITIDSSLGTEFAVGTLKICLMPLCRQLKDAVELSWTRSGELYSVVEFIGVGE